MRAVGAGILLAWLGVRWCFYLVNIITDVTLTGFDYNIFRVSALQLLHGQPIYEQLPNPASPTHAVLDPNLNHPLITLWTVPFAIAPFWVGYLGWVAVSVLGYLAALWLAVRITGLPRAIWGHPVTLMIVVTYASMFEAVRMGQISPLLAPLVVLAWGLLRRDRTVVAAMLVGVIIALKLALLPLGALVLVRRRWQEPLAALGGAVGISALALPFVGFSGYHDWLTLLRKVDYASLNVTNMSLVGLVFRLVQPAPPPYIATVITSLAIVVAVLVMLSRVPSPWHPADWRFSVLLIVGLLGSPIAWDHYGPLLIPVFATVLATWPRLAIHRRVPLAGGMALLLLAIDILSVEKAVSDKPLTVGTILCGGLLLMVVGLLSALVPYAPQRRQELTNTVPVGE